MGSEARRRGRTPQPAPADVRYLIQGNTSLTGGTWTVGGSSQLNLPANGGVVAIVEAEQKK